MKPTFKALVWLLAVTLITFCLLGWSSTAAQTLVVALVSIDAVASLYVPNSTWPEQKVGRILGLCIVVGYFLLMPEWSLLSLGLYRALIAVPQCKEGIYDKLSFREICYNGFFSGHSGHNLRGLKRWGYLGAWIFSIMLPLTSLDYVPYFQLLGWCTAVVLVGNFFGYRVGRYSMVSDKSLSAIQPVMLCLGIIHVAICMIQFNGLVTKSHASLAVALFLFVGLQSAVFISQNMKLGQPSYFETVPVALFGSGFLLAALAFITRTFEVSWLIAAVPSLVIFFDFCIGEVKDRYNLWGPTKSAGKIATVWMLTTINVPGQLELRQTAVAARGALAGYTVFALGYHFCYPWALNSALALWSTVFMTGGVCAFVSVMTNWVFGD